MPPTMHDWQRVKDIFADVLDQPEDRRDEYLRDRCSTDDKLLAEVKSLLAAHDEPDNLIEINSFDLASKITSEGHGYAGKRFGNYKIIREIGRGGMGAVFLAERTEGEFDQQVALKIVRQTFDNDLEKRFRLERQILANLNHPHIAKLLDGGVSETGVLYLAMEYIEGAPLLEYAETKRLEIEDRLNLFLKICSAVAYAHRNLTVHRDIKPSNILVTKDGEPKLLDFGLAKMSQPPASTGVHDFTSADQTQSIFRAFTPAYASPEQIFGRTITTASDVYSLGVVLYELLTGERPFNFENKSLDEILRTMDASEPVRPSSVISQESNVEITTPEKNEISNKSKIKNPKLLRGDLDTIVLKALRKEPEMRYESVEQFAQDIERHLRHLPITARPQTFSYRASKFVQRNKIALGAAVFVIISLVTGITASLWQANIARAERDRAERRFQDVRRLSNALLFELSPKIERLPGATEAREILVKNALEYLDELAQEAEGDLQLQSELAVAYAKIGDLQGNPAKPNLSDFAGAISSYEKANAIRTKLPPEPENHRILGENYRLLSAIYYVQNNIKKSLAVSEDALKIYESLLANDPGSFDLRIAQIEAQIEHGQTFSYNNQYATAIPLFRTALSELAKHNANDRVIKILSATAYSYLGNALSWDGKQSEAEIEMAKAVAIAESLIAETPNDTSIQQTVWRIFILASSIYEGTKDDISFEYAQKALQVAEIATATDAADTQSRHNVAKSYSRLGIVSALLNQLPHSIMYLERAEKVFSYLIEREPKNHAYQNDLGRLYTRFGDAREKQRDFRGSLAAFQKSADLFEAIANGDEANTLARRDLAQSLKSVGIMYLQLGDRESSKKVLLRSLDILNSLKTANALGEYDNQLFDEVQAALLKNGSS